jgi:hypothetical protein
MLLSKRLLEMTFIPDIAQHGMFSMNFFFHAEGAYSDVDAFWAGRGIQTDALVGLAYYEVGGLSVPHTASVQWRRSGDDCCDVRLAVDAVSPGELGYPDDGRYHITEESFRDFLNFVRTTETSGIIARYGAAIHGDLGLFENIPVGRLKRIVFEAGSGKTRVTADFTRDKDSGWRVTLEPARPLIFYSKPVDDDFFTEPLKTGAILVAPLLKAKNEERPQPLPERD